MPKGDAQVTDSCVTIPLEHYAPMAYTISMRFVETPVFTKRVKELLADEDYRALQVALLLRPEQGPVIKGSGGLRKVRWARKGAGKRGGIRVIYYWHPEDQVFYMLFAYEKTAQADLTPQQLKILARLVREEFE